MDKQTKRTYLLFFLALFFMILHNIIYGVFGREESVSFLATLIFFLSFVISLVCNVVKYNKGEGAEDLWKAGWIGLLGILGLFSNPGLYGLFGFFGFFGLKEKSKLENE